jgi:hypothetical protein
MLEDTFTSGGGITMSTTNQALFPILNNTKYITGYYEAEAIRAMTALSVHEEDVRTEDTQPAVSVPSVRTAKDIQEEEDKKVLSLLGEKRITDRMIKHYRALGKISFV